MPLRKHRTAVGPMGLVPGASAAAEDSENEKNDRIVPFEKTKLCKFFIMGTCTKGPTCHFAHDRVQLKPLPDLFRTKICKMLIKTGVCENPACRYAHNKEELREAPNLYTDVALQGVLQGTKISKELSPASYMQRQGSSESKGLDNHCGCKGKAPAREEGNDGLPQRRIQFTSAMPTTPRLHNQQMDIGTQAAAGGMPWLPEHIQTRTSRSNAKLAEAMMTRSIDEMREQQGNRLDGAHFTSAGPFDAINSSRYLYPDRRFAPAMEQAIEHTSRFHTDSHLGTSPYLNAHEPAHISTARLPLSETLNRNDQFEDLEQPLLVQKCDQAETASPQLPYSSISPWKDSPYNTLNERAEYGDVSGGETPAVSQDVEVWQSSFDQCELGKGVPWSASRYSFADQPVQISPSSLCASNSCPRLNTATPDPRLNCSSDEPIQIFPFSLNSMGSSSAPLHTLVRQGCSLSGMSSTFCDTAQQRGPLPSGNISADEHILGRTRKLAAEQQPLHIVSSAGSLRLVSSSGLDALAEEEETLTAINMSSQTMRQTLAGAGQQEAGQASCTLFDQSDMANNNFLKPLAAAHGIIIKNTFLDSAPCESKPLRAVHTYGGRLDLMGEE